MRKSFKWFFLFMLLSSGVAHIFLHFSTRIYSSKGVLIHIAGEEKQSLLGIDKTLPNQNFTPTDFQQDVRVITSPIVVNKAFSQKGLNYIFYEVGDFRSLEIYPNPYFTIDSFYQDPKMRRVSIDYSILINQQKDSVRLDYIYQGKSWGGFLMPGKPYTDENIYLAISNLDQKLLEGSAESQKSILFRVFTDDQLSDELMAITSIEPNSETFAIQVSARHPSKSKAALTVELLMDAFMDFHLDQKMESLEQSIAFLDQQIDSIKPLYDDALIAVRNAEAQKGYRNIEALGGGLYKDVKELQRKLVRIEYVVSVLEWFAVMVQQEEDLNLASTQLSGEEFDGVTRALSVDEILKLEYEKESALMQVTPEHPTVVLIERNLDKARATLITQVEVNIDKTQQERDIVVAEINKLLEELDLLPLFEAEYLRLKRDYEVKSSFYNSLLDRKASFTLSRAGIVSDYIILEVPKIAEEHVAPDDSFIRFVGLAIGAILSLILVVIRYITHKEIINIEDITSQTETSLLGVIQRYSEKLPMSSIVVTNRPKSGISESFRGVRSNLEFLEEEKGFRSIAVTSTIPGEGKTFVAINLAAIIAMQGKRVLLVDVDLRKPRIHKIFDLPNSAGMSTLLNNRSIKEDITFSTLEENLWAIPAGPVPPNPSELIGGDSFVNFLDEVKTSFEIVIFDTPPIGLVTDAIPVISRVNNPIYVLRADYSHRAFVGHIESVKDNLKVPNLSIVLNDYGRGVSGSYYNYGYGYGYG
ncbi:MAG: polysaccharide biosynthesis tyrosine autokinase, partial [Bacteroidota bacterium]|nr:polysaccharide biosynthesis tyrosine autokinase [Bacteroidota bacterium]